MQRSIDDMVYCAVSNLSGTRGLSLLCNPLVSFRSVLIPLSALFYKVIMGATFTGNFSILHPEWGPVPSIMSSVSRASIALQ